MAIFEHVGRDDEPAPREQPLRRWEALCAQANGNGAARLREEPGQHLWRQAFVRARDRKQDGIRDKWINSVE